MFKNLDDAQKKTLIAWLVFGICIFLIVALISFKTISNSSNKNKKYSDVTDETRYYTVASTIEKYYSYVNAKNYESIIHMLDSNYVKVNNITEDNVKDYLPDTSENNLSYVSRTMCYKNISTGIVSYLVKGFEENTMDGTRHDYKYYKVILDGNEFRFSITPIEEEDYTGGCNND